MFYRVTQRATKHCFNRTKISIFSSNRLHISQKADFTLVEYLVIIIIITIIITLIIIIIIVVVVVPGINWDTTLIFIRKSICDVREYKFPLDRVQTLECGDEREPPETSALEASLNTGSPTIAFEATK